MRTIAVEEVAKWDEDELQDNVLYLKDRLRFRELDEIVEKLRKSRKMKLAEWVQRAINAPGPIELLVDEDEDAVEDADDDEEEE